MQSGKNNKNVPYNHSNYLVSNKGNDTMYEYSGTLPRTLRTKKGKCLWDMWKHNAYIFYFKKNIVVYLLHYL